MEQITGLSRRVSGDRCRHRCRIVFCKKTGTASATTALSLIIKSLLLPTGNDEPVATALATRQDAILPVQSGAVPVGRQPRHGFCILIPIRDLDYRLNQTELVSR
jgi:hypothetical protein